MSFLPCLRNARRCHYHVTTFYRSREWRVARGSADNFTSERREVSQSWVLLAPGRAESFCVRRRKTTMTPNLLAFADHIHIRPNDPNAKEKTVAPDSEWHRSHRSVHLGRSVMMSKSSGHDQPFISAEGWKHSASGFASKSINSRWWSVLADGNLHVAANYGARIPASHAPSGSCSCSSLLSYSPFFPFSAVVYNKIRMRLPPTLCWILGCHNAKTFGDALDYFKPSSLIPLHSCRRFKGTCYPESAGGGWWRFVIDVVSKEWSRY